jgi:hypothetical protein
MLQSEFGRKSQARTSAAAKSTRNIAVQRNALDQKLIFYYLATSDPERISELGLANPLRYRPAYVERERKADTGERYVATNLEICSICSFGVVFVASQREWVILRSDVAPHPIRTQTGWGRSP